MIYNNDVSGRRNILRGNIFRFSHGDNRVVVIIIITGKIIDKLFGQIDAVLVICHVQANGTELSDGFPACRGSIHNIGHIAGYGHPVGELVVCNDRSGFIRVVIRATWGVIPDHSHQLGHHFSPCFTIVE